MRARAAGSFSGHEGVAEGGNLVESAKFAAGLRAMRSAGVLAPDVRQALSAAGRGLDEEGAAIAARVLSRFEVAALAEQIVDGGAATGAARGFSAGLALRPPPAADDDEASPDELVALVYDLVHPLARLAVNAGSLTGKAKLAAWMADGLANCPHVTPAAIAEQAGRGSLGGDRMVLARAAQKSRSLVPDLCEAARGRDAVPAALMALAWADPRIGDAAVIELGSRIEKPKKRAEDLPEDEVDLDPACRSIEVLERAVLSATGRANVAPRAALAVIALDSRRARYVLSAMPLWKGRITGGKLARVLRQNAGALSAAHAETRARASRVEGWTERLLSEGELSIAVALGHVTCSEVARRLAVGRQHLDDGISLAAGALARAALEGVGLGGAAARLGRQEPRGGAVGARPLAPPGAARSRARAVPHRERHRQPRHLEGRSPTLGVRGALVPGAPHARPARGHRPAVPPRARHPRERDREGLPRARWNAG